MAAWLAVLLSGFLGTGCASPRSASPSAPETVPGLTAPAQDSGPPPAWRIVYLIHGDADYLYHDEAGKALQADREALHQAVEVAENTPRAEVFIFHQGPAGTRMFRSVPGGTFLHFRGGKQIAKRRYADIAGPGLFTAEAALFQTHVDDFAQPRRVLAYFGHEIPVQPRAGYSASRPHREYSAERFAEGLSAWARPGDGASKPFDLIVLSTCNGGTPPLLKTLVSLADYVVASPANLHLSYFDTRPFATIRADESVPGAAKADTLIRTLADEVADRSFERLSRTTATEITVAVYDLEKARSFLTDFQMTARTASSPAPVIADSANTNLKPRWRDCERDPAFDPEIAKQGVRLWFRAPRFGPRKEVTARSAWECAAAPTSPSRP